MSFTLKIWRHGHFRRHDGVGRRVAVVVVALEIRLVVQLLFDFRNWLGLDLRPRRLGDGLNLYQRKRAIGEIGYRQCDQKKIAKCLKKLPKNGFTRKMTDFNTFTKIAKECWEIWSN